MGATWQPTDSGGAIALVVGAILAAAIAGPVAHAAAELLRIAVISVAVVIGLSLAAGAALVAYRVRQRRAIAAARGASPRPVPWQRTEPLSAPRRSAAALPTRPEVHLHFHGVSADDIAAILARRDE